MNTRVLSCHVIYLATIIYPTVPAITVCTQHILAHFSVRQLVDGIRGLLDCISDTEHASRDDVFRVRRSCCGSSSLANFQSSSVVHMRSPSPPGASTLLRCLVAGGCAGGIFIGVYHGIHVLSTAVPAFGCQNGGGCVRCAGRPGWQPQCWWQWQQRQCLQLA